MSPSSSLTGLMLAMAPAVLAQGVMQACTKANCQDCPVTIGTAGKGYPNCVVYDSDDVFKHQGFHPDKSGGGWDAYWNIPNPDPDCGIILKSPAGTEKQGCGVTVGAWENGACSFLPVDKTFMVQFCCGEDDCRAAGWPGSPPGRRGLNANRELHTRSIGDGMPYVEVNGTRIEPIQVGKEKNAMKSEETTMATSIIPSPSSSPLKKEKRDCDWKYTPNGDTYTRPASNTQVLTTEQHGPVDVQISRARTQSRTTTFSAGIEGIFSAIGVSVGSEFSTTHEITTTKAFTYHVPAGQNGAVGFTAFLKCTKGTMKADGCQSEEGEGCIPYKGFDGHIAGEYAVIVSG